MDPNNLQWHQRALPQTQTAVVPAKGKQRNRTWDENYQVLLLYKEENGNVQVPHKYDKDRVLAKWCSHIREYYHAGQLSQERVDALEAVGFVFNPHEKKWNETYQRLVAFWKENGHSKVPTIYKKDPALGKWVSRQREDYSGGYISENRRKKLDAVGFIWRISKNGSGKQKRSRPDDKRWDERYEEMKEFYREHGHSNVPRPDGGQSKLAGWVGVQRCNYGRGLMPPERVAKLKELDFIFNYNQKKKQEDWNRMYELLKCCKQKDDGSFHVASVGDDASSLSRWIQRQREKYKLHKMEAGREVLLRKLDFRFPERAPRLGNDDDDDHSEDLKKALAEIDNARAEDLFGAEDRRMRQGHMKGDTSMVRAIVDLAQDQHLAKKVAESFSVLSKFMSLSPEELATRVSAPMENRPTTQRQASLSQEGSTFGTLMPLIVSLRETASESAMQDCVDFLVRMIKQSKSEGWRVEPPHDPDAYNKLLTLAVELGQALDQSAKSKAVIDSCAMYFKHTLAQEGGKRRATGDSPAEDPPAAKKQRLGQL